MATGATEEHGIFLGSDLPGVMLGRAAAALAGLHGVSPGERAVVVVRTEEGLAHLQTLIDGGVRIAATAVSVPLLLDRQVSLRRAILTSVRAVGENPGAMALWAGLIMAAIALSMLTLMAGFAFAVPVIGHATWHAYRDLVDTDGVPPRH